MPAAKLSTPPPTLYVQHSRLCNPRDPRELLETGNQPAVIPEVGVTACVGHMIATRECQRTADRFDQSIKLLRRAGFRSVLLRGDTAFSQTKLLDRWDSDCVEFAFGMQASPNLSETADCLPETAWRKLERSARSEAQTHPRNVKADIVLEREYYNQHLCREDVAEFDYCSKACKAPYRIVVLRKLITHERGQKLLHTQCRNLFYISNTSLTAERVVTHANDRCAQARTIGELKSGVNALRMPLGDLMSNWTYSVIATLAWNMSRWIGLVLPATERWGARHAEEKGRVVAMRFRTFVQRMMPIPAQVLKSGRRLLVRLLDWNPSRNAFFR